jgi:Cu/Ag efflux protein CusF
MRKILIILVALFAMVAFASGVIAQEKKAEQPAPAAEKAKAVKAIRAFGTVSAYEAGKTITVKGKKEKEWTFDIAPDAKIKGEVKEGAKVQVMYKKDGDKMIATSIAVGAKKAAKKKMKEEKKEEEKK